MDVKEDNENLIIKHHQQEEEEEFKATEIKGKLD